MSNARGVVMTAPGGTWCRAGAGAGRPRNGRISIVLRPVLR
ncbi:hypothetical protein [Nonomuraea basaltis]|nr:hypothetical protein [Nonomuraea basaltis]